MTVENLIFPPAHPRSQYLDQYTDFGVWVPYSWQRIAGGQRPMSHSLHPSHLTRYPVPVRLVPLSLSRLAPDRRHRFIPVRWPTPALRAWSGGTGPLYSVTICFCCVKALSMCSFDFVCKSLSVCQFCYSLYCLSLSLSVCHCLSLPVTSYHSQFTACHCHSPSVTKISVTDCHCSSLRVRVTPASLVVTGSRSLNY
jgi:hypothetical protein